MKSHSNLMKSHSNLMKSHSNLMKSHSNLMKSHSNLMKSHSNLIIPRGSTVFYPPFSGTTTVPNKSPGCGSLAAAATPEAKDVAPRSSPQRSRSSCGLWLSMAMTQMLHGACIFNYKTGWFLGKCSKRLRLWALWGHTFSEGKSREHPL